MEVLLQQLLEWVGQNPGWAYVTVFLIGMAESVAFFGVLVPGVVILIGAGALVAAGAIAFWPTFLSAVAGAIVGDGISYHLGRHFDQHIRSLWPFSKHPDQLDRGVAFFDRYGGWSVAFGRFFGPVRAVIPLVAGMMRLPPERFYVANVASAIPQIFSYLVPGMLFGASIQLAAEAALRLVVLAIMLIGSLWFAIWFVRRLYLLVAPHASALLQGLLRWTDLHPTLGGLARALADPEHPDARALTGLAFLLVLGVLSVGTITGLVLMGPIDLALNQSALDFGQSLRTPPGDRLMVWIGHLGDPKVILPLVAVMFGYLRWRGHTRDAYYWLASAGFALACTPMLGVLMGVPRPDLGFQLSPPWSFPSGPVLLSTSVYGFLAISLARGLPQRMRWIPYALASVIVIAVAWSRVYLGAEWLTDVIGSIALGLAWIGALGLAFRQHSRPALSSAPLGVLALSGLAAGLILSTLINNGPGIKDYEPNHQMHILTRDEWLADGWKRLPDRRADLRRLQRHPLTIQYAGNLQALELALSETGWQPAKRLSWGDAIRLLSPSLPLPDLPVIPQVHDGNHESLVMDRTVTEGQRQVLRLWPSRFQLTDGTRLWIGSLTVQAKEVVLDLLALPVTTLDPVPEAAAAINAAQARLPAENRLLYLPPETPRDRLGEALSSVTDQQ